jgi:hypothetical protein
MNNKLQQLTEALATGTWEQLLSLHEEALNELEGDTEKLYAVINEYLQQ